MIFAIVKKASKAVDSLADYAGIIQACGFSQLEGLNHYYRICRMWFFSNTSFTPIWLCNITVIETQGSTQLRCLLGIFKPSSCYFGRACGFHSNHNHTWASISFGTHSSHWAKRVRVQRYARTNPRSSQIARTSLFQPIEWGQKVSALLKWTAEQAVKGNIIILHLII